MFRKGGSVEAWVKSCYSSISSTMNFIWSHSRAKRGISQCLNHSRHHNNIWFPAFRKNLLPPFPTQMSDNFIPNHVLWFITYVSEEPLFFPSQPSMSREFHFQQSTFRSNLFLPCPLLYQIILFPAVNMCCGSYRRFERTCCLHQHNHNNHHVIDIERLPLLLHGRTFWAHHQGTNIIFDSHKHYRKMTQSKCSQHFHIDWNAPICTTIGVS
jgi:hypothetical protein